MIKYTQWQTILAVADVYGLHVHTPPGETECIISNAPAGDAHSAFFWKECQGYEAFFSELKRFFIRTGREMEWGL